MASGIERGGRRSALVGASLACTALLFAACGGDSDEIVRGEATGALEELEVRVGSGEPWAPVETVAEVAGMADLVAVVEITETTTSPAPPTGEGAVARTATARVHELVWMPPGDEEVALVVGASVRLGAGLVGHRDGEYTYRILANTQPWFETNNFYLVALVDAYGGWGVLPSTSFLVDEAIVRPVEGQQLTPFGEAVTGAELQQVEARLVEALTDAEHIELRRLPPERRIDAVLAERIAAARAADEGE